MSGRLVIRITDHCPIYNNVFYTLLRKERRKEERRKGEEIKVVLVVLAGERPNQIRLDFH